jgi:hypothetical protein
MKSSIAEADHYGEAKTPVEMPQHLLTGAAKTEA